MSWFRLPNAFSRDPKILEAGANATLLHIAAIAWSDEHLTDGQIPASAVSALWPWTNPSTGRQTANATSLAARLVSVGLWSQADRAYQILAYHEMQRTAEDITRARKQAADRMARLRCSRELLANADETSREPDATFGRSSEVEERREEKSRKEKRKKHTRVCARSSAMTRAEPSVDAEKGFEAFYAEYPRRQGKEAARQVWIENDLSQLSDRIMNGLVRYKSGRRVETGFILSARNWLEKRHWEDDEDPEIDPFAEAFPSLPVNA